ncbi:hypothetical protein GE09DRAFT_696645 [Coniochaeta sp. 2T2.1]|nr:hypothetical protein GE09DRAFT_696645 [Coniochaeta sp. 2T2.1]
MATDLIMPRLQDQQQSAFFTAQPQAQQQQPPTWQQQQVLPTFPSPSAQQQPQQQQQPQHMSHSTSSTQQISPLSTSGSAGAASPTTTSSPKAYHTRQIRPLYMPAVLRPTEHPSKAPLTRRTTDSTTGNNRASESNDGIDGGDADGRTLRSNSSFITLSGALLVGRRLSRRSTGDSGKGGLDNDGQGEWECGDLDAFPAPKGLPTREHWKPDNESTICDHPACRRHFGYLTRRHHCRRCGNIFCDFHSAFEIPLDEAANYNPRGVSVRACSHCYGRFREWRRSFRESKTNSRDSSVNSSVDGRRGGRGERSPLSTSPMGCKGRPTPPSASAEVAVSVPRDWNWSTF